MYYVGSGGDVSDYYYNGVDGSYGCLIPPNMDVDIEDVWGVRSNGVIIYVSSYNGVFTNSYGCYGGLLDRNYCFHSKILVVKIAEIVQRQQCMAREVGWCRRHLRHCHQLFLRAFVRQTIPKFYNFYG